jgi:hypothetical protein
MIFDWRDALGTAGKVLYLVVVAAIIAIGLALLNAAHARWKPEYANAPQAVQDWYQSRELTEAAQSRFHFKSCCAHSDVVKTKFKVGGAGNDQWWWLDGEAWKRIPDDVIHWNEHAPDGMPVMFAVGGNPVCFYPPDGGI